MSPGRVASIVLATSVVAFTVGFGIKNSGSTNLDYAREDKFRAPEYASTKEMETVCQPSGLGIKVLLITCPGPSRNPKCDFRGDDQYG
jgi:hypothetical protein